MEATGRLSGDSLFDSPYASKGLTEVCKNKKFTSKAKIKQSKKPKKTPKSKTTRQNEVNKA